MQIEVVSYISPINSLASHNKEVNLKNETVELISAINHLVSEAEVPKKQTIVIESYVSTINGAIVKSGNEIQNVTISLSSFVSPINGEIDVRIKIIPNVTVCELSTIEGQSSCYYIENPSFVEVI
ncbi:hypothetical protein AN964_11520 [Heyndrickxia shackletonii]|uniref:Uncharacterized protein n=2 Tax=Heyndrickxia shackletonii TaxID=157838 RepID=A0A0Q3WSG8_9BACI|nr:hypothetical protein [Heyndrickxia shackletonii]KQL54063.1 hypothetical protein AN964_11520 [Heyndrickxia shackletonii]